MMAESAAQRLPRRYWRPYRMKAVTMGVATISWRLLHISAPSLVGRCGSPAVDVPACERSGFAGLYGNAAAKVSFLSLILFILMVGMPAGVAEVLSDVWLSSAAGCGRWCSRCGCGLCIHINRSGGRRPVTVRLAPSSARLASGQGRRGGRRGRLVGVGDARAGDGHRRDRPGSWDDRRHESIQSGHESDGAGPAGAVAQCSIFDATIALAETLEDPRTTPTMLGCEPRSRTLCSNSQLRPQSWRRRSCRTRGRGPEGTGSGHSGGGWQTN